MEIPPNCGEDRMTEDIQFAEEDYGVRIELEWEKNKGFRFLKFKAWLINLFFSPYIVAKVKEGSK